MPSFLCLNEKSFIRMMFQQAFEKNAMILCIYCVLIDTRDIVHLKNFQSITKDKGSDFMREKISYSRRLENF